MAKSTLGYVAFCVICGGIFVLPVALMAQQALQKENSVQAAEARREARFNKCQKDLAAYGGDTEYFCREYAQK